MNEPCRGSICTLFYMLAWLFVATITVIAWVISTAIEWTIYFFEQRSEHNAPTQEAVQPPQRKPGEHRAKS